MYLHLVRWRISVCFSGRLGPGRGRSPAQWARAQSHIVGVLPPFPRVDHEVAESGACRRQSLSFSGFDRGGFDDGHQNSFRRVVAKNNMRVLVISHHEKIDVPVLSRKSKFKKRKIKVSLLFDCFECALSIRSEYVLHFHRGKEKKSVLRYKVSTEDTVRGEDDW